MKTKPIVFVFLSRFPYPLEKGDKLRAYNQLIELNKQFEVHLFCLNETIISEEQLSKVKQVCSELTVFQLSKWSLVIQILLSVFSKKPFQVHYFFRKSIQKKIHKQLKKRKPDLIYCQLIRMAEYVKNYHDCPKYIDYMDALSKGMERRIYTEPIWKRWFYRMESKRLKQYEGSIFDYFEGHSIISEQDRNAINHPKQSHIQIIRNGVDLRFFEAMPEVKKDALIVFTGNFSYAPNIEAAEYLVNKILPELKKKKIPGKILISGANPSSRVLALASENVEVTGFVEDIRESYHRGKIFVAPLFIGSGLQNKLLEAMSCGLICITTTLVNNSLKGTNEENILLAENLSEFVELIEECVHKKSKFNSLSINAKQFIEQNFLWETQNQFLTSELLQLLH